MATQELEHAQREVLESIARDTPLHEILVQIVLLVEGQAEGMLGSILLVDAQQKRVHPGAAPSLPPEYCASIDGFDIGPKAGSCGTAAFLGERVIVEDIATHPYWADYRHLALPFGLRACWSTPILTANREVLGTFAMYYREPRAPTDQEMAQVDRASDLAAIAILRDRSAHALRYSEARYRQIVDTAYEGVWVFDAEDRTLFVNQRAAEMLGYTTDEMIGRAPFDFTDQPDRGRPERGRRTPRRNVAGEQHEARFRRKDGSAFWAMVATSSLRNEQDEITGTLRMITDITQLKRTESALRQSAEEFRAVFERSAIGMALVDVEGHPVRTNPALERALGYSAPELRRMAFPEFTHPDDIERDVDLYRSLVAGERESYQIEKRFIRKSGEVMWGHLTVSLIRREDGEPLFGIGMVEDITEHKQMEGAFRSSERLRALVYNQVSDVLFYVGVEPEGRIRMLSVNPAFSKLSGLNEEQIVGRLLQDILPSPVREAILARYARAIRERRTITWDHISTYPTGQKHGEISITPIYDENGICTNLVGSIHDVTERKQNEERIVAQAALLDKAKDAILVRDIDGIIRYWNSGAERLYGWSSAEVIGRSVSELIYRDPAARDQAHQRLLENGEWAGELVQFTKAGKQLTIEASWTLLSDEEGKPKSVLAIATDITARRNLELQMYRAQRMDSLGTLAGGIAHDFNNILAGIVANVACANYDLAPDHPAREFLSEIDKASARATDLARQILTFSRHQDAKRRPVELAPVVAEALRLLRATLPATIEIRTEFAADLPTILAEPTQVHQIVMNLGTNAAHAIGRRPGRLSLRADRAVVENTLVAGAVELPPGLYARLTVEDTGSGMDEAIVERIFDPFFTTKEPGEGTGLGLSVVHGIMKSYEGGILVRSTPGKGTAFTLYFPAAQTGATEAAPGPGRDGAASPGEADPGRRQRVLCIDDEAAIVRVTTRLLQRRGYRVTGHTDALRALEVFESDPTQFDAVVTDLSMPGISGFDLSRRLLEIRPGIPIVVTSGRFGPEDSRTLREIGVSELVLKPTNIDDLLAALTRLLHGAPGATLARTPATPAT
jgi:PAS domain S-box-containing protein